MLILSKRCGGGKGHMRSITKCLLDSEGAMNQGCISGTRPFIDQAAPTLLEALHQPGEGSGTALQALRKVMSMRRGFLGQGKTA